MTMSETILGRTSVGHENSDLEKYRLKQDQQKMLEMGAEADRHLDKLRKEVEEILKRDEYCSSTPHDSPWIANNILLSQVFEEMLYDKLDGVKAQDIHKGIIEKARAKGIKWVKRLERMGLDLVSKDWRGSLKSVVNFHDAWHSRYGLMGVMGQRGVKMIYEYGKVQMREPREVNDSASERDLLKDFWSALFQKNYLRVDDIGSADMGLQMAAQQSRGIPAESKWRRIVDTFPIKLAVLLTDKLFPKLGASKKVYRVGALSGVQSRMASIEDTGFWSGEEAKNPQSIPAELIKELSDVYGFNKKEIQVAVWGMMRLKALISQAVRTGKLSEDDSLADFAKISAMLVSEWNRAGYKFSEDKKNIPMMEQAISRYESILGIPAVDESSDDRGRFLKKSLIAKLVRLDLVESRLDGVRFADIARQESLRIINGFMAKKIIKTEWVSSVADSVNGDPRWNGKNNYMYTRDEFPNTYFPGPENGYKFSVQEQEGFAFSRGNYMGRYLVPKNGEKMKCVRVSTKNHIDMGFPEVVKKEEVENDDAVFAMFNEMLKKAHQREMLDVMPDWGINDEQGVLKGLIQYRYDGMPWRYRFAAVVHGLGLEEHQDELEEFMQERIKKGLLDEDAFFDLQNDDKKRHAWQDKKENHLPDDLLSEIKSKIDSLPDRLFPRDFISMDDHSDGWMVFLGPELFKIIKERVDKNSRRFYN